MANPYLTDFSAGLATHRTSATPSPSPQRALDAQAGPALSAPMRFLGGWSELLGDLGALGKVWVETEQHGVRISQFRDLSGMRVQGLVGHLQTSLYQVRVLLDRCGALGALDDGRGLAIEDDTRETVVRIRLDASTHALPLRVFLSSLGARGRRVVPASAAATGMPHPEAPRSWAPYSGAPFSGEADRVAALAPLDEHPIGRLQRDCEALASEPSFQDVAELSGRMSMSPRLLRGTGGGVDAIAIDPSLIPCALETLADQVHPLAITSGSHGWVSRSFARFYGHHSIDGQLVLRGDDVRFALDVRAIDSAWVVGRSSGAMDGRTLRLYDDDGRAMAVIGSAAMGFAGAATTETGSPTGDGFGAEVVTAARGEGPCAGGRRADARLWTTLINALTS